ncbi:MAG TPA: hypothetical protein VII52_16555, partial [Gemmatimonadaceae bacterium]
LATVRGGLAQPIGEGAELDRLRQALQTLYVAARHANVLPERMPVELKCIFADVRDEDGQTLEQRAILHAQIVTFVIGAYFSDARA